MSPLVGGDCVNGGDDDLGIGGDGGVDDGGCNKYEGEDRLKMQRYRKNNSPFCRIQG
jgi:hypothetical protein